MTVGGDLLCRQCLHIGGGSKLSALIVPLLTIYHPHMRVGIVDNQIVTEVIQHYHGRGLAQDLIVFCRFILLMQAAIHHYNLLLVQTEVYAPSSECQREQTDESGCNCQGFLHVCG